MPLVFFSFFFLKKPYYQLCTFSVPSSCLVCGRWAPGACHGPSVPSQLPKLARLLIACHCRSALSCWAPSLPPWLASYSLLKKHIYLILCPSLCSPHAYSHGQTSTSPLQAGGGGGRGGSAEGKLRCVHRAISLSTTFGQLL